MSYRRRLVLLSHINNFFILALEFLHMQIQMCAASGFYRLSLCCFSFSFEFPQQVAFYLLQHLTDAHKILALYPHTHAHVCFYAHKHTDAHNLSHSNGTSIFINCAAQ